MAVALFLPAIDSWMDGASGNQDDNHGAATSLELGPAFAGADKTKLARAIVNFNVAPIAGSGYTAAELRVYRSGSSGDPFAATIYRCTRPSTWTEGGVTWLKYNGSSSWTAGGGDYDASTPAPIAFTALNAGWNIITGMKPFVDDAISSRGNLVSLILRANDENPGTTRWVATNSREGTQAGEIVRLMVFYPGGFPLVQSGPAAHAQAGGRSGLAGPHS